MERCTLVQGAEAGKLSAWRIATSSRTGQGANPILRARYTPQHLPSGRADLYQVDAVKHELKNELKNTANTSDKTLRNGQKFTISSPEYESFCERHSQ